MREMEELPAKYPMRPLISNNLPATLALEPPYVPIGYLGGGCGSWAGWIAVAATVFAASAKLKIDVMQSFIFTSVLQKILRNRVKPGLRNL